MEEACGTQEVSPRVEPEVNMEAAFAAVIAYNELEVEEPGCTQDVSSRRDPETNMQAAFAVLADSEPKEEGVGATQQVSSMVDSRMEAAFAVFADSDFEDDAFYDDSDFEDDEVEKLH